MLTASSAEGLPYLTKKGFPRYDTKLHLVVRLQFWNTEECGVSVSLSLLPDLL